MRTATGVSCGGVCGRRLPCGRHVCKRVCHEGECGACGEVVPARCFCGKEHGNRRCTDMPLLEIGQSEASMQQQQQPQEQQGGEYDAEKEGEGREKPEENHHSPQLPEGSYSCQKSCGKLLACGYHACEQPCHAGPCGQCQLSPSLVTRCPCGKTPLEFLTVGGKGEQGRGRENERYGGRLSCVDPVPVCGQICEKILPCGQHRCQAKCHSGSCPACEEKVTQKCACGETSRLVPCHQTREASGQFRCAKKCGRKKSCGKHRCTAICCSGSNDENFPGRAAILGSSGGSVFERMDDPHTCLLPCGKKLRCGQHSCSSLCHAGHCPPCLEASFEELTCACGSSAIPPPVPCGTPRPICAQPCCKARPCGHVADHACHMGDCPPCTVPVAKACVGGHVTLRGVPCGSKDIKCSNACGKKRRCGVHACLRLCHDGACDTNEGVSEGSDNAAPAAPSSSISIISNSSGEERNLSDGSRADGSSAVSPQEGGSSKEASGPPAWASSAAGAAVAVGSGQRVQPGRATKDLSCGQLCGAPLLHCPHACQAVCHPGEDCPNVRCPVLTTVHCACGRLSGQVQCGAGGKEPPPLPPNTVPNKIILPGLPTPLVLQLKEGPPGVFRELPAGQGKLSCNEDCERLQRRKVLADAFKPAWQVEGGLEEILGADGKGSGAGEKDFEVPGFVMDLLRTEPKWMGAIEARLQYLVLGPTSRSGTTAGPAAGSGMGWPRQGVRVQVFRGMGRERREAIQSLAARWNVTTVHKGPEPNRLTVVYAGKKSRAPSRKLPVYMGPVFAGNAPPGIAAAGAAAAGAMGGSTAPSFSLFLPGSSAPISAPLPDPDIDLNPACVLALSDLPPSANVASQLLRFGGECNLIWINESNAVVVFEDPARAATAARVLDHVQPYWGTYARVSAASLGSGSGSASSGYHPTSAAAAGASGSGAAGVGGSGAGLPGAGASALSGASAWAGRHTNSSSGGEGIADLLSSLHTGGSAAASAAAAAAATGAGIYFPWASARAQTSSSAAGGNRPWGGSRAASASSAAAGGLGMVDDAWEGDGCASGILGGQESNVRGAIAPKPPSFAVASPFELLEQAGEDGANVVGGDWKKVGKGEQKQQQKQAKPSSGREEVSVSLDAKSSISSASTTAATAAQSAGAGSAGAAATGTAGEGGTAVAGSAVSAAATATAGIKSLLASNSDVDDWESAFE